MKRTFEEEYKKRLEENKRLTERKFLPGFLAYPAALLSGYLFYVMVVVSFMAVLAAFSLWGERLLKLSRLMLLL